MADKTPELYYKTFLNTWQGTGQCVAGFQHFCAWVGYPQIVTGNNCAWNYGVSDAKSREIQQYFVRFNSINQLQNGDWYISRGPTQWGHVAMMYENQSFGQNQIGSGHGYVYTLRPFSVWSGSFICGYRPKIWAGSNFTGSGGVSSGFRKYNLPEDQLRGIAALCEEEQSSAAGAAKEASLLANRFELYGASKKQASIYATASSSWFADKSRARLLSKNPSAEAYAAVKDVLVNGNRKLPNYIDEHDCVGDISKISTGDYRSSSNFISGQTKIFNNMGASYTFYCWGDETKIQGGIWGGKTDPFGYTDEAQGIAKALGLNGTVGVGTSTEAASGYSGLYSTMNDRNDATLRESAYMTKDGTQSLEDTNISLSVINYTSTLASMYAASGASVSDTDLSGIPLSNAIMRGKVNSSKVSPPQAKEIFDKLFDMGALPTVICGILGNIYQECKYDSSLIERGSGAGAGLCQWTGPRRTLFVEHVPDWQTCGFAKQVEFMVWEVFHPGTVNGAGRFQDCVNLWNGQVTTDKCKTYVANNNLSQYIKLGALENSEVGAVSACAIWLANHEGAGTPKTSVRINETRRIWNQLQFIE